jgi:hypothetical protein
MSDDFYASIPVFDSFQRITDPTLYRPLPAGWLIGFTDVVHSTQAIAEGRFKAVNMAGAAAIAAASNALGRRPFPYAFGGDGALLAVAAEDSAAIEAALAGTADWARRELQLDLRAALVPVADIRAAGHDVTLARYAPSPDVDYAMFAGGGVGWVEQQVKQGAYLLAPQAVAPPDLTGLSCRWGETPARRGMIASILILPTEAGADARFRDLIGRVLEMTADAARAGHPIPATGPALSWPPAGIGMEASARLTRGGSRLAKKLAVFAEAAFGVIVLKLGLRLGSFDAKTYTREVVANTDFRKFDDGLRMTLDCAPDLADELEALLQAAAQGGIARFGIHRQAAALVTCIVPSPTAANHVHFVDGASGGYTAAAKALKQADRG